MKEPKTMLGSMFQVPIGYIFFALIAWVCVVVGVCFWMVVC